MWLRPKQVYPAAAAAAAAKSLQLCLTLCDPIDGSPLGSPIPGILQARILEWVAIFLFNAWKWKVKMKLLSCVWFLETPWTAAYQAPLSMGFSGQEYCSGLPLPSPGVSYWVGKSQGRMLPVLVLKCGLWSKPPGSILVLATNSNSRL